MLPLKRYFWQ